MTTTDHLTATTTTTTDHFTTTTTPLARRPADRSWGARHWTYAIIGRESDAMHTGIYSDGGDPAYPCPEDLHADILAVVAIDAQDAAESDGTILGTLEALDESGLADGIPHADAYRLAEQLAEIHRWAEQLTGTEFSALTELMNETD